LVAEVEQRGVDFELTDEVADELRQAGAASALIRAVGANRRSGDTPPAKLDDNNNKPVSLGLVVQDLTAQLAATLNLTDARGAWVTSLEHGGLAEKIGVERRDVIVALNDAPISDTETLRRQAARLRAGAAISLIVMRDGARRSLNFGGKDGSANNAERNDDRGVSGKGRLGLRVEPLTSELIARFSLGKAKGMVVTAVDGAGPAGAAGVQPGDVIEEVNGQDVRAMADVEAALAKSNAGRVRLRINRGGKSLNLEVQPRA
ncbi:MAG TPA: PDZ domain-containing protein, partial [Pyrinomonadaceae bacterium]|nr:PDZ domain-containing protein [Pyrinomonadaceae bacterium]